MNILSLTEKKAIIWIGAVALTLRIILNLTVATNYTMSDGIVYHNIAVNLASGNGYSMKTEPPFEPCFYREPATSLFMSAVYLPYRLFGDLHYLTDNYSADKYTEITCARFAMSLLGTATCIVFFLTIRQFFSLKLSFIIAILASTYIPLAVFSNMLMRENMQTFAVVCMNYFFMLFILRKRLFWIFWFSAAWALSNMTLQITIYVIPFIFVFLLYYFREIRKSIIITGLTISLMTIFISPWLIRSYVFSGDWRVIKTLGVSQTYEYMDYLRATGELKKAGLIDADSLRQLQHEWYAMPESAKFSLSYAGYFQEKASFLRAQIPKTGNESSQFIQRLRIFRNGWIESLWISIKADGGLHARPHALYLEKKEYFWLILSLSGFIFGYIAFIAMVIYYKRLLPMLLMFTFFFPLLIVLATEPRRALPIHLYIFMFSCLSFFYLYKRFICRMSHSDFTNAYVSGPGGL